MKVRNLAAMAPILKKSHYHQDSPSKSFRLEQMDLEEQGYLCLNKSNIQTIYLDMDGVLVDHNRFIAEKLLNISKSEFENILKSFNSRSDLNSYLIPKIIESVDSYSFRDALPTNEFSTFISLIDNWIDQGIDVQILSSSMNPNGKNDEIIRQKQLWLYQHNLDHLKQNFPQGSHLKTTYAKTNSLLIDDSITNIERWLNKELKYYAIHHTSILNTLQQLDNYGL